MPWKGRNSYKGESVFIPEGRVPWAENMYALPAPVPDFVHALQTECDPAGTIRENVLVKEENYTLHKMSAEFKGG